MNDSKIPPKQLYRERANSNWPVFFQPWWLDVVASDKWEVALITDLKNEIIACMPYTFGKNNKRIMMPPITPFLGALILKTSKTKYSEILSHEMNLVTELLDQIGKFTYYEQRWSRNFTNWLPLFWQRFKQCTKYTYVIKNIRDLDAVKMSFRRNIKDDINKALKKVKIHSSGDTMSFYKLYVKTFNRQGMKTPYTYQLIDNIITESVKRDQGRLFFAEDDLNQVHSALFIVWDNETAYYIASGSDPDLRNSGATSLLYWEAIRFASTKTKSVDFSGSMVKRIEKFLRSFGAVQVPYFEISKTSSKILKFKQGLVLIKKAITTSQY